MAADPDRPTIALVSREVWPFYEGGGIGRHVYGAATALAPVADVTVVLPDTYRNNVAADDPRLPEDVRYVFAPEPGPEEARRFTSLYHAWSASACATLRTLHGDRAPDLVEFAEYTGEAAVTTQARRSGDAAFAHTRVAVRTHGSDELHRALNGMGVDDAEASSIVALERIALRDADVVLAPHGGLVETYERLYADTGLAPIRTTHWPIPLTPSPQPPAGDHPRPLRLLHLGRLERRKGVEDLVRAVVSLDSDDVALTLIGRDTSTGPGGSSMLEHLRLIAAGDPRVDFRGQVPHHAAMAAVAEHDVMVFAARWDAYPSTAREAIAAGRPVLATPTGGTLHIVEDGVSGWFTPGTGAAAIAAGIERLLADREAVDRLVGSGAVTDALARCVDNAAAVEDMLEEARSAAPGAASPRVDAVSPSAPSGGDARPSVGVAVVARGGGGSVADTLLSLSRQEERAHDVVIAPNGRHAARSAAVFAEANGARVADGLPGGDVVVLAEAGTTFAPGYVARIARAAGADPEAAYVTTWSNAAEPSVARPLGTVPLLEREDCGGEVLAVRAADAEVALAALQADELAGGGAWFVARRLLDERRRGVVIPEELVTGRWTGVRVPAATRRDEVNAALRTTALGTDAGRQPSVALTGIAAESEPLLSVVMAAYNAEDTIRASVESALGQSEERLELIVVDDGSEVPVAEVLSDARDERLRIIRHPRNRGLPRARNTGLKHARGMFLSQLDADDLWAPGYASTLLPCFDDPAIGLAYSNARLLGHPQDQELSIQDASVHPLDRFPKFAEQNPVPSPTAMMRIDAVRAVGGYLPWAGPALDYHLYAKLIAAGWRFAYVDRPLAWYRWPQPERGMSHDTRNAELADLRAWLAFFLRHPGVPGPRRQLRVRLGREVRRLLR